MRNNILRNNYIYITLIKAFFNEIIYIILFNIIKNYFIKYNK